MAELRRIEAVPRLPRRPQDSHKGLYGSVLVVAGCRGMAGAAALVGASALRSGAGLVRVACPAEVQPTVATFEPSYMTYPLPCDADGLIDFHAALGGLERCLVGVDVLAIGPGLGQSESLRNLLLWVVRDIRLPTVIDADGLNNLKGQDDAFTSLRRPVILTPHPGEFARLLGMTTKEVQANREALAVEFARTRNLVLVLKGSGTIVTDGERLYVNPTGNPGMATGGAGDSLTGVIAALLGQRLDPFEAAQLGTYVHGLAGDIARDQSGEVGMIAGDIVDALPDAFYHLGASETAD